jgi:hypothetical protein
VITSTLYERASPVTVEILSSNGHPIQSVTGLPCYPAIIQWSLSVTLMLSWWETMRISDPVFISGREQRQKVILSWNITFLMCIIKESPWSCPVTSMVFCCEAYQPMILSCNRTILMFILVGPWSCLASSMIVIIDSQWSCHVTWVTETSSFFCWQQSQQVHYSQYEYVLTYKVFFCYTYKVCTVWLASESTVL